VFRGSEIYKLKANSGIAEIRSLPNDIYSSLTRIDCTNKSRGMAAAVLASRCWLID